MLRAGLEQDGFRDNDNFERAMIILILMGNWKRVELMFRLEFQWIVSLGMSMIDEWFRKCLSNWMSMIEKWFRDSLSNWIKLMGRGFGVGVVGFHDMAERWDKQWIDWKLFSKWKWDWRFCFRNQLILNVIN